MHKVMISFEYYFYLKIADKVPIKDKPNSDSSYSIDVLSGGESEYESLRKKRAGQNDS